jgi:DNA-binding NarL/FixJ family response regulator
MTALTTLTRARPAVSVTAEDEQRAGDLARRLAAAGLTVVSGDPDVLVLASDAAPIPRVRAIEKAHAQRPDVPIVALMPDGATGVQLRKALRAGASGIVLDTDVDRALAPTVVAVAAGQLTVPAAMRRRLAPRALSHREKEILGLVVRGLTNRQIADELFLAESTVKTHLSSAFGKLDARSRAEAAALILDPEEGYGPGILTLVPDDERDQAAIAVAAGG